MPYSAAVASRKLPDGFIGIPVLALQLQNTIFLPGECDMHLFSQLEKDQCRSPFFALHDREFLVLMMTVIPAMGRVRPLHRNADPARFGNHIEAGFRRRASTSRINSAVSFFFSKTWVPRSAGAAVDEKCFPASSSPVCPKRKGVGQAGVPPDTEPYTAEIPYADSLNNRLQAENRHHPRQPAAPAVEKKSATGLSAIIHP